MARMLSIPALLRDEAEDTRRRAAWRPGPPNEEAASLDIVPPANQGLPPDDPAAVWMQRAILIAAGIREVRARIARCAARVGRDPATVHLIAVSKGCTAQDAALAGAAGVRDFGENRVQEALPKLAALPAVHWHMIGQLQRNKCRFVAGRFALVHTLDRPDLAESLERASEHNGSVQDVLIQVSLAGLPGQGGTPPAQAGELLRRLVAMPHVRPRGLMAIAPPAEDPEQARPAFATLRVLRDRLQAECDIPLPELSMGMSSDYEVAVEEGATLVRVGRAIFGQRRG